MVAILRILLRPELGIDIEQRGGRFGSTPLFVAIWRRNWEAAELLLKAGANPLSVDSEGTCYSEAKRKKATRIVALMDEVLAKRKEVTEVAKTSARLPIRSLDRDQGGMDWQR